MAQTTFLLGRPSGIETCTYNKGPVKLPVGSNSGNGPNVAEWDTFVYLIVAERSTIKEESTLKFGGVIIKSLSNFVLGLL